MKKSKINKGIRLLSIMLSLVMAFSIMPVSAREASASDSDVTASGTCGDNLTWVFTDDGTLTISGTGAMKDWSSATAVSWYSIRSDITEVVIEEGAASIGTRAFYYCTSLKKVTIPDSVSVIGEYAFYYCGVLDHVVIPEGVTSIEASTFSLCYDLADITLPDSIASIGSSAFFGTEVTEFIFSANLTSIASYAFWACSNLREITFTGDAPEISSTAFSNDSVRVYYPAANSTWNEETLLDYGGTLLWVSYDEDGNPNEETLDSGTCGKSLTWTLTNTGVLTISGTGAMTSWTYSSSVPWYTNRLFINSVILEEGVTTISSYAFYYCSHMTQITIPEGVTRIGNDAFFLCASLLSLEIPSTVKYIGESALTGCEALASITVAEGNSNYTSIDGVLFNAALTELIRYPSAKSDSEYEIPDGVTSVDSEAFYEAENLTRVIVPEGVTAINAYTFYDCTSLISISLPASLTSIGNWAFSYCISLTEITIPESVTAIGVNTFYSCTSLNTIVIPSGVTSLGSRAFQNCSSLKEIRFEGNAPDPGSNFLESVPSGLRILYHSSADGWEEAMTEWDVPANTVWYDLDAIISADKFTVDSSLSLEVGESSQLSTNADSYTSLFLEWSSGNSSVAYVSQDGKVTGLSAGTAVVTVQTEDGTYKAQCTVTVTESSSALPTVNTVISDSTVSNNISDNNYSTYGSVIKSYLYDNDDGTLTRVEYISGTGVVVETIDQSTGQATAVTTLEMELSIWGGFYSGEEYNFLVFGQTNYDEDDSVEVIRVIKYSKNWERLDACSICGYNTYYPFAYGSLKMTETDGNLYIRSCHQMYVSSDGKRHQANMTFVIDEEEMTVEESHYLVASSIYGYVSHSFNQFIQTDGEYIYCVDHGDAYPRAINLSKASADGSSGDELEVYSILGETGENATGVSIGGFELSTDNCLIVGNSVDMSDEDTYDTSGQRNIFLIAADKDLSGAKTIWLTDYAEDDGITPRTPQLVSVASDIFLIMWEEVDSDGGITTKLVLVDADGNLISDITELNIRLSDCQPVVTEDGIVTWYVTNGYRTTLYQINPFRLSENEITVESIASATVTLSNTSYTYNGTARTPSVTVTAADGSVLTKGVDYTVSYSNNTDAGTAVVTVTGIGSFTGTVTAEFTINGISLSTSRTVITLAESEFTYTGSAFQPEVTSVTYNGTELTEGVDYTISYGENTNKGYGYVYITGIGNYTGSRTSYFTITAQSLSESNVTLEYENTSYTGSSLRPSVTVTNAAGTTLTSGTDYTVSYSNNKSVGTATVTVTGKGNYTGTVTKTFTIEAQSLFSSNVTLGYSSTTYTGSALTPSVTVKNSSGATLTKGTDYTVSYSDNTEVGTATVTITGAGNYTGTVTKTFTITAVSDSSGSSGNSSSDDTSADNSDTTVKSIESANVALSVISYTYDGTAKTPSLVVILSGTILTKGTDYTVSYSNNTNVGTAMVTITGTGNYTGTVTATFTIKQKSISSSSSAAKVTLPASSYTYNGAARKPTPTVKITLNGSTKTLTKGTDYTVTYKNNTSVGTAMITITGTGNYTGTVTKTFTIKQKTISSTSSAAKVTLSATSYTYNGAARKPTPTVKITLNGSTKTLTKGTDYTITYKNNTSAGTATVTITGTGNYKGTLKTTFTIKQKNISSTSSAAKVTLSKTSYTYNGSAKKPTPTVKITLNGSTKKLTKGTDYTVTYKNNTKAGTATVTITGKGNYKGTLKKTFTINKASQTLKATYSSSKTVKYSKVKSAKQTVSAITKVSGAKGTVTYTKSSGSKYLSVSKTTGKITVKKGTPKGTYKIKVNITSASTTNYKSASKTVTITVKVK